MPIDHRPQDNAPKVYGLKDPQDGKYRYVGQSVDPVNRLKTHISRGMLVGNLSMQIWLDDLTRAGREPTMDIFAVCNFGNVNESERHWIRKLIEEDHPILNLAEGGTNHRGPSGFRCARKRNWIEIGYLLKTTRETATQAIDELSKFLPQNAGEMRKLRTALKAINTACSRLDDRLCREYPSWKDVVCVLYGGGVAEHCKNLKRSMLDND